MLIAAIKALLVGTSTYYGLVLVTRIIEAILHKSKMSNAYGVVFVISIICTVFGFSVM